jgi:hypothetical protein
MRPKKPILLLGAIESKRIILAYALGIRLSSWVHVNTAATSKTLARELENFQYEAVLIQTEGFGRQALKSAMAIVERCDMTSKTITIGMPKGKEGTWLSAVVSDDVAVIAEAVRIKIARKRGPKGPHKVQFRPKAEQVTA